MANLNNNTALTTLAGYFQFLKGYSALASKTIMVFIAGLGIVSELYNLFSTYYDKDHRQRKTRLATYGIGLGLNTLYAIGSVLGKVVATLGLGVIALGAEFVVLARLAYQTHGARMDVIKTKSEIDNIQDEFDPLTLEIKEALLATQREYRFVKKVEVSYSVVSSVSAILFVGGLFVPPLALVSIALFATSKVLQTYDNYTDYKFSRYLSGLVSREKVAKLEIEEELMPRIENLAEEKSRRNSLSVFKSLNIDPTPTPDAAETETKIEINPEQTTTSSPLPLRERSPRMGG